MAITIKDVAARAGVSCATASLALNGKNVNEETRKRVIQAAEYLKYYRSSVARNLITGRSNTVGLYVLNSCQYDDLTETVSYYHLIRGVIGSIEKHGFSLDFAVKNWEDSPKEFLLGKAYSRSVDGMLIIPQYALGNYDFVQELEGANFPFVVLNPTAQLQKHRNVTVDNYSGMYFVLKFLSSVGIKTVGFINGPQEHYDAITLQLSFLEHLSRFGLELYNDTVYHGNFTQKGGYQTAKELISVGLPDAIVCSNDEMAVGAMRLLMQKGIRVPEDISIFGYGDGEIAQAVYPQLSTVFFSMYDVGKLAANRLMEIILNPETSEENLQVLVEPKLILRESCRLQTH